ncbi:MAG: asparagine--tRNA ligase [Armatimonadetes bacterium]|nr:asparagine--tRNA ligase [Armatimonadota bacterium]
MVEPGQYLRDLFTQPVGSTVVARGWVKTVRSGKGVSFLQLSDGSCFADLQVVADPTLVPEGVATGACLSIEGELVASPGSGQAVELQAKAITVLGTADAATYPLQPKRHTFEFLREQAHLRVRSNTFGAVFRVRSAVSWAIHKFFQERGFLYVHTPIITTSDAEGAGAMFGVTTLDLQNLPRTETKAIDFKQDFFGKQAHLTVSGQLEAEIFALAFTNCYTFGPTFRAENSNTPRHLAEAADLEFFTKRIDENVLPTLEKVARSTFGQITYTEAISILEKASKAKSFEFPVFWGCDLQSEHERYLTDEVFQRPVIVTDYPKEIKAFYMRLNDDEKTVRAMDVLAPRIGEIIGGSQREERYDVLIDKIRKQELPEDVYWWYLELRKYGSAPHAGFGLGLERLVLYLTGMKNIRDVIPFPRTPGSADF